MLWKKKKLATFTQRKIAWEIIPICANEIGSVGLVQKGLKRRYRKIPKISPGAYIFQRPFLRGLILEGLKFGGACLRREIRISKSIGLALQLELNLPFLLCFSLYLRAIFQVQAPRGLYLEGQFKGGFFALPVRGAYIWRGFYMEGLKVKQNRKRNRKKHEVKMFSCWVVALHL